MKTLLATLACLVSTSIGVAQDRVAETKKQLGIANDKITRAEVGKAATVETADLLVVATVPEAKAKSLAAFGQKAYDAASAALKNDKKEVLWPGKLTVFLLKDREDFSKFFRKVLQERPDVRETVRVNLKGNEPYLLVLLPEGPMVRDADVQAEFGSAVAEALLKQKAEGKSANAALPDWLRVGFGNAIVNKLDGQAGRAGAMRLKLRSVFVKSLKNPMPPKVWDVWGDSRPMEFEALATSVTEYFVFGPEWERFPKMLQSYRTSDDNQNPTTAKALELLDLKPDALDTAWRAWVVKQR